MTSVAMMQPRWQWPGVHLEDEEFEKQILEFYHATFRQISSLLFRESGYKQVFCKYP